MQTVSTHVHIYIEQQVHDDQVFYHYFTPIMRGDGACRDVVGSMHVLPSVNPYGPSTV